VSSVDGLWDLGSSGFDFIFKPNALEGSFLQTALCGFKLTKIERVQGYSIVDC
jgi:hypothetical protein